LKLPPPPEIIAWVAQDVGANVQPLTPEAWSALMEHAGLTEVMARTYSIKTQDEARGILKRYGWTGMLGVMGRMLLLYIRSRAYRNFVKQVSTGGVMPDNLQEYFGYGLFVGKK
jgi:hypothetical protein